MTEWKTVSDGCGEGEKEKKGEEKGPGRVFMLFVGEMVRRPPCTGGSAGRSATTTWASRICCRGVEVPLLRSWVRVGG